MRDFKKEYKKLNERQKQAVDYIDGPVLVVAGPGTGKTQLLAMRAANILVRADIAPSNILCLTFTDNAARNMRERLVQIIGQPGYHAAIHTFHSFGADIINQYPDSFVSRQLIQQVDELGLYEILKNILDQLPHNSPLGAKAGDKYVHIESAGKAISWLKQNALTPDELEKLLRTNGKFVDTIALRLIEVFAERTSPKHLKKYSEFLNFAQKLSANKTKFGFLDYGSIFCAELEQAINGTDVNGRYAPPITAWRMKWCQKDSEDNYVLKDSGINFRKMNALCDVYRKMQDHLTAQGLYDFDDMIMETVHAMESDDELLYNLQERYQYVLVDEFQDTNKAQLRMLTCLGNNPVYENRPNIMAVGDDDQAIYAFQGANISNMAMFPSLYDRPKVINLQENYRSNPDILEASEAISTQITDRLTPLDGPNSKKLVAKVRHKTNILRHQSFSSELAQYDWLAGEIKKMIAEGSPPEEIAVIAPKHKYLERLMPYLGQKHIPVSYERRENILDAPVIVQLLTMSDLVVAIAENRQNEVDELIACVLSYDFFAIESQLLIELSIDCFEQNVHWLELMSKHKNKKLREICNWFVNLARASTLEPMEYILDELTSKSPLRSYYFDDSKLENAPDEYLTMLGQLATLRQRLRQWKPNKMLLIKDLSLFVELHRQADIKIIDVSPHTQSTNAVQVMTPFKAKGLEFQTVFIINAQDEVWGTTAKGKNPTITLPKNLPIQPAGNSDDDKLRLLFVALTRAKHSLTITSYTHSLENKLSPILSFIMNESDVAHPKFTPKRLAKPRSIEAIEILSTDWSYRFKQIIADKKTLFEPILNNYKLSVTHLNNFIDVTAGGPNYFFMHNLLHFPEALSPAAAYGDSVHKTLQWVHLQLNKTGKLPANKLIENYFSDLIKRKHLRASEQKKFSARGREALNRYLKERSDSFLPNDKIERGFGNEGIMLGTARLSGKIDKLRFSEPGKIEVIDFKTGKPALDWKGKDEYEKVKLHKYRQQLLFYKILVENSASYVRKAVVTRGALEFIELDDNGSLARSLSMEYTDEEINKFKQLIGAVWGRIMKLNFPDTNGYSKNLAGIKQFEEDLIAEIG